MRKTELIDLHGLEYNKPQTVRELKAQAKNSGLRGYSQMRKAELIALLYNNQSDDVDKNDQPVDELKIVPTAGVGKYLRGWKIDINSNMDVYDVNPIISSKINEELDDLNSTKCQLTVKMSLSKTQTIALNIPNLISGAIKKL